MLPSLELNWVRNADKSLLLPAVVFSECLTRVAGYYCEPWASEEIIDGRPYDRGRGIIVVSAAQPDFIPSIIAHEWRHHWQRVNWGRHRAAVWEIRPGETYDEAARRFFWDSPAEADALRFEARRAYDEHHGYYRGILGARFGMPHPLVTYFV